MEEELALCGPLNMYMQSSRQQDFNIMRFIEEVQKAMLQERSLEVMETLIGFAAVN